MQLLLREFKGLFETGKDEILFLHCLRAFAILIVVLFHTTWYLGFAVNPVDFETFHRAAGLWVLTNTDGCVDCFLFVSGFLIARTLIRQYDSSGHWDLKKYFTKRVRRILPVYVVTMILCFVFVEQRTSFWANILFVNNFVPFKTQFMAWAWYLGADMQLYLIAPLIMYWVVKSRSWPLAFILLFVGGLLATAAMILQYQLSIPLPFHPAMNADRYANFFDGIYDKPYTRGAPYFAGMLLAILHVRTRMIEILAKIPSWVVFALLVFAEINAFRILFTTDVNYTQWSRSVSFQTLMFHRFMNGFSFFALGSILLLPNDKGPMVLVNKFVSSKIWLPLSKLTLPIYLIHPIILTIVYKFWQPMRVPDIHFSFVLIITLSTIAGFLLYVFVEKPAMGKRA